MQRGRKQSRRRRLRVRFFSVRLRAQPRARNDGDAATGPCASLQHDRPVIVRKLARRDAETQFAGVGALRAGFQRVPERPGSLFPRALRAFVCPCVPGQDDAFMQQALLDAVRQALQQGEIERGEGDDGKTAGTSHGTRIGARTGGSFSHRGLMRVLDTVQMRAADAAATSRLGDVELMRRAGRAIAGVLRARMPRAKRFVAFAGPGNNGGDAFAALAELDPSCDRIVYAEPTERRSAGRRDAEARARASGVRLAPYPAGEAEVRAALADAEVALDGLLGIGARPGLSAEYRNTSAALATSGVYVVALDLPTGVDADTGAVCAGAVRAHCTVTLGAWKLGLFLDPARTFAGELVLGDLGIDADVARAGGAQRAVLDDAEFARLVPLRPDASDKRRAGAPLLFAGSARYPGAAILCARGAARAGAGYVTTATVAGAEAALRAHLIEQVVVPLDQLRAATALRELEALAASASAFGTGPGLDTSAATGETLRAFLARTPLPFVADAGAFTHLAGRLDGLRGKRCVLTPHAGEFARLDGGGELTPETRVQRLRAFVARTGITTLLKGPATLIDDGTTLYLNPTGSSALATAGTGDVLTGIIATLLSQGLAPADAARAGAYWHGLAGRCAEGQRPVGVIAGDVAEALPFVMKAILTRLRPEHPASRR